VSWDEADCDLDGRKGAGSRGASGNRMHAHQDKETGHYTRNVITGEGLRTYLSKNHSDHRVEDGKYSKRRRSNVADFYELIPL
jgi:hypothetical protein